MSARDEFLTGLAAAGGTLDGTFEERSAARASVHAMFSLGLDAERELDARLDGVQDEVLAEADLLPKADVVAWLVKKAREGTPVWALASKFDRGAVRPDNLRMLPPDFFEVGHTYAHDVYRFRCEYIAIHPTHGRRSAWGWFGHEGRGWRYHSFSERQYEVREWTDVTEAGEGS